ncbi:MAG: ABC transporter ATP-binding protein [Tannerella sp.]|jgi:ABC-2 type transport system ATP-binding protein|nr:ABC transporter ATP-binding protein [Tannerella sp.]
MDTRPVIECKNITHYYGNRLIYKDLNFEVHKGKILGLLGKNGTGKTTVINILNGYLKPRAGVCSIFGEEMDSLSPATKGRIGLLLEGHIQHSYFNVMQIERYYSRFFSRWNAEAYFRLIEKLQVTKTQKISTMSCGQRSQVALGLLFAQDPDLLILDDFSMGLDPGYRRLFVEYLKEFAERGDKTVFLTSHIIQDMEMLIDDCIILDYGKILLHEPTEYIMQNFRRFTFVAKEKTGNTASLNILRHTARTSGDRWETYSFASGREVGEALEAEGYRISALKEENLTLEDAFIGLTGKY